MLEYDLRAHTHAGSADALATDVADLSELPWGTHVCQFYENRQDQLDILVRYFRAGLERHEFGLWVIDAPLTIDDVTTALRRGLPNADAHLAARDIQLVEQNEWRRPDELFDGRRVIDGWDAALADALARGHVGMRVGGNPQVESLTGDARADFVAFERALTDWVAGKRVVVLCTYPLANSSADDVFDAARAHQYAVARRRGEWEVIEVLALAEARAAIHRRNEELEQRVEERTRELAAANDELRRQIEERERVEAALRESKAKLGEAERIAHVGYWEIAFDTDRLVWSDETYRILGLRPGVHAPTMRDYAERIHAEDRAHQADAMVRAQRGDGRYDVEYRIVRPDGEVRVIHSVGEVIFDAAGGGQPRRAIGVVQDITERKEAERALAESHSLLHAVVDSTADSIFVKDLAGRYLLVNAAGALAHGSTVEHIVGKDDWTLFPEEVAREMLDHDQEILASGEPRTFEHSITSEGVTRTFVTTKSVYRDVHGRVLGLVGISSDVTELKRLEEQLRQAQKMEAVGQLAGGVAHDFNNLLTIVTGYGAMLRAELHANADARADVEEILAAAQRAGGLTRQLLAFSRRQVLQPRVVHLNQAVTTTAAILRRLIGEDIALHTALAPNAWSVYADPGQLEQVVMNLAVNARDAMPHGGTLRVRTANVAVDAEAARGRPGLVPGEYAVLTVEDTGTGIDPAVLPRLFEPFFTTKGPGKGTGLGLATVYGIVAQSDGHVYVDSTLGEGSRFTVYLPRHAGEPEAADVAPPPAPPRGTEVILLVEDEASVRTAARRMLERLGYRVLEGADGAEALRIVAETDARGERVELVLTDVVMPEQGGRALGERLAERWPGLKVVYMSGYTDDEIIRRGLVVPGANFLEKPFTMDRLAEIVRRALDQPGSAPRP